MRSAISEIERVVFRSITEAESIRIFVMYAEGGHFANFFEFFYVGGTGNMGNTRKVLYRDFFKIPCVYERDGFHYGAVLSKRRVALWAVLGVSITEKSDKNHCEIASD